MAIKSGLACLKKVV